MKSKSKHNQKKLRIPNIANNDTEENISNLIRPTPKKIPEINKSQNYLQKTNPFKSFENKTNISEGSSSFSRLNHSKIRRISPKDQAHFRSKKKYIYNKLIYF